MENVALKNAAVECLLTRLENEEKKDLNEILRLINTLSIMEEYDSLFKRANELLVDEDLSSMTSVQLLSTFNSVTKNVKVDENFY